MEMARLQKADSLARDIHLEDSYGDDGPGNYFSDHILKVLLFFMDALRDGHMIPEKDTVEDIQCAILLHDTIEDHPDELTLDNIEEVFGAEVADIVDIVTHRKNESYCEYIMRVVKDPRACMVKFCDLVCNIREGKNGRKLNSYERQRMAKYELAAVIVINELAGMGMAKGEDDAGEERESGD